MNQTKLAILKLQILEYKGQGFVFRDALGFTYPAKDIVDFYQSQHDYDYTIVMRNGEEVSIDERQIESAHEWIVYSEMMKRVS